jgi:hypothetical protein
MLKLFMVKQHGFVALVAMAAVFSAFCGTANAYVPITRLYASSAEATASIMAQGLAVNSSGQVGGLAVAGTVATQWAGLWSNPSSAPGEFTTLDSSGLGSANAINDNGWTTGYVLISGAQSAKVWTPTNEVTLPLTPDANGYITPSKSWGYGINGSNYVVGQSVWKLGTTNSSNPSLWQLDGDGNVLSSTSLYLDYVGANSGVNNKALAISVNGVIVGQSLQTGSTSVTHGSVWTTTTGETAITNLNGFLTASSVTSSAFAVSPNGEFIVGLSNNSSMEPSANTKHAALWNWDVTNGTASSPLDLGTLGGTGKLSQAFGVNDSGIIVGSANTRAVMWEVSDDVVTMTDLNTLIDPASGWTTLYFAQAINNSNTIAGYGLYSDGKQYAFTMTVPEPGILALLGCGLVGLAVFVWKKRR